MRQVLSGAAVAVVMAISALPAAAQAAKPVVLGSAHLAKAVMADGKSLAAGTYSLRVSDEKPAPVVGQTADESRWIEFVQGGTVTKLESWAYGPKVEQNARWTVDGLVAALGPLASSPR